MKCQKSLQLILKWSTGGKKACARIHRDKTMWQIPQILLEKLKYQVFAQRSVANCPLLTPPILPIFALSASEQNLLELSYPPPPIVPKTLHIVPCPPHQLQAAHDLHCGAFWVPTDGHNHHKQFPILKKEEALPRAKLSRGHVILSDVGNEK